MSASPGLLPPTLQTLHRELGVPADYFVRHRLPFHAEADESDLVEIGRTDDDRPIRLVSDAANAWQAMQSAAAREGITLIPISGFRSIARQAELIRLKIAAGESSAAIFRYVAAPGFSEHHSGRALDIGSPEHLELDADFALTAAYRWLQAHAGKFGFHESYPTNGDSGIGYEPWHWYFRQ